MKLACSKFGFAIKFLLVMVCIASMSATMWGQSTFGTIVGTVTDPSGAVIPGVAVTLTNLGTADKRTAETDANGAYRFSALNPAVYRVDFEINGFKHTTRDSVTVQVEAIVRIDAALEVGNVSDTIEVTAETPLLQTDSSTVSSVVEAKTVQEMPLNGRNVMNLIALVPGVVPQGSTAGQVASNQSAGHTNNWGFNNYQIGGGQSGHSSAYLDGAPTIGLGGNMVQLISTQDAVQEFRVATNNISPEYGRFNGGVVNMQTKSGTNQWHGSAYEYFRNTVLNSNDFFANRSGRSRSAFNQNQYGATLGGPVRKDKTFFFFSWEQFRAKVGSLVNEFVPTQAQKNGDFSANLGPGLTTTVGGVTTPVLNPCDNNNQVRKGQIFDPNTTRIPEGSTVICRTPFANNIIPANRINSTANIMMNVLKMYPDPNASAPTYNYAYTDNPGGNQQQFVGRVDQTLSDNHRIFGRFSYWTVDDIGANRFANQTGGAASHQHTHQIVLGDTYSFSPTLIMDSRLSYTRGYYDDAPPSLGFDLSALGPAWATLNSQVTYQELVGASISDMAAFKGMNITTEHFRNTFAFSSNLTKIAGRHTLKFGGEIRFMDYNYAQSNNPSGNFTFNYDFTSWNGAASNANGSGVAMASFMLGYAASGQLTTVSPISQYGWYSGFYLNDTFQVNNKLTLNYGLRWEQPGGIAEKYDRATVLLPDKKDPLSDSTGMNLKGQMAFVNSSDWSTRNTTDVSNYKYFSPRVGFAYRLTPTTVVRGGYGISWLPIDPPLDPAFSTILPAASPINQAPTTMVAAGSSGVSTRIPLNTLSNPFPAGGVPGTIQQSIIQPLGRNYNLSTFEGLAIYGPIGDEPLGYSQQWNLNIQKELKTGLLLEVGYAGARAIRLPVGNINFDQLLPSYLSLGSKLLDPVPNPFFGKVNPAGGLNGANITRGQSLTPYPQFASVKDYNARFGTSVYNSMQVRVEKRFGSGGIINANYTWSKSMGNVDSINTFLESSQSTGTYQDYTKYAQDWSLSSFDVANRFVASYVLELPFGKGKKFASGVTGAADKLISGWSAQGIITLQDGYPVGMKATAVNDLANLGFGALRPNYVPGCVKEFGGKAQDRLSQWFNTACFVNPPTWTLGTEARTDPQMRSHGVNNWDFTLTKNTRVTEKISLQFKAEFFNIFNRVQFRVDSNTATIGNANYGKITAQRNQPRLVQFALRFVF
jgi:hypothetical protein